MTRLPGNRLAGQRFAALTQPADILPTLLRAHSGMGARGVIGTKGELGISWLRVDGATTVSVRLADWYAILPPDVCEAKLYRKPDDRWEVNEVGQHHGDWLDALYAFARAWLAGEALPELKPPGG